MLPLLVGLLVAAGPLLGGASPLWVQSVLFLALIAGGACWLFGRVLVGYLPLPSARTLQWIAALGLLGALCAYLGPAVIFSPLTWRNWAAALWIFLAIAALSKDERSAIDHAIRFAAWTLLLLAFYQHFHQGLSRPPGTLLSESAFAGTVLMLLPLAVQKKDWILTAGLLLVLVWTRSLGAWLGFAAALIFIRRSAGAFAFWTGAAIGFLCLVGIYGKLQTADFYERWNWWLSFVRLAAGSPWLGLCAGLWLAGVAHCLKAGGPHKTFGAAAVLVQSLWDAPLSVPANLWLFGYFCASAISESSRGINIPSRFKPPLCALVAVLGWGLACGLWDHWAVEEFRSQAAALKPKLERHVR